MLKHNTEWTEWITSIIQSFYRLSWSLQSKDVVDRLSLSMVTCHLRALTIEQ